MTCNLIQREDISGECNWAWPTILMMWIIFNCSPMWLTIYLNRRLRTKLERDANYKPFVRTDYENWSYVLTIFTHFFFIPRLVLAWAFITSAMIGCAFIAIGHKRSEKAGPIRRWLFSQVVAFGARGSMLMYGMIWCSKQKVKADYSDWLGPEWKLDSENSYKGAGTFVANHQGFVDILVQLSLHNPAPGYVAKEVVRRIWGVGYIAEVILQSLFVTRSDSKNKFEVFNQIQERQKQAALGQAIPISIFPEGCSTNGNGIINFKKGAFASLLPVQPYCFKYRTLRCKISHGDATHYHTWLIFAMQSVLLTVTMYEMPVFEPNEYFWLNHWNSGKEEKWVAYARAIRQIIAQQGGFELYENQMEEKLQYKRMVRYNEFPSKIQIAKTGSIHPIKSDQEDQRA